ncbi:hypothetical protein L1987_58279 [Smallanthus sonchifolius]|uniref:Uncharacterized protein n=1 Tax=Smallanthus sonchifolius TaxID=185202 RepID=A0ACB9DFN8_9ASTR|nr:hypothetical protein L1987_58279 [Smallanthus sonchifolius]
MKLYFYSEYKKIQQSALFTEIFCYSLMTIEHYMVSLEKRIAAFFFAVLLHQFASGLCSSRLDNTVMDFLNSRLRYRRLKRTKWPPAGVGAQHS